MLKKYLAALIGLLGLVGYANASDLTVREAWVREGPPTAKVLAGYLTIENSSEQKQVITGAQSTAFEQVEMHRTEHHHEGHVRMISQDQLEIPAGGRLVLEPGGNHLMLMGAKQVLRAGDVVDIILKLKDGHHLTVKATVKKEP